MVKLILCDSDQSSGDAGELDVGGDAADGDRNGRGGCWEIGDDAGSWCAAGVDDGTHGSFAGDEGEEDVAAFAAREGDEFACAIEGHEDAGVSIFFFAIKKRPPGWCPEPLDPYWFQSGIGVKGIS